MKITNTGKHEEDINGRINKGKMAISKLNILLDRDITIKTKTNIYNTIVKSTITYGSETWHLKSGTIGYICYIRLKWISGDGLPGFRGERKSGTP